MAYDEKLTARIRDIFADDPRYSERKMFGGVCFMLNGNMCCGTAKDKLMVRVGPEAYADCLAQPHASPMTFTGKALKGYVYVDPAGVARAPGLLKWVKRGADFVSTLPPKLAAGGPEPRASAAKQAGGGGVAPKATRAKRQPTPTAPKAAAKPKPQRAARTKATAGAKATPVAAWPAAAKPKAARKRA